MPQHATSIRIPEPCTESWAAMVPAGPGRHCAACQKAVVDFSLKSDAEILAFFRQPGAGQACGRFRAGQLRRALQLPDTTSRWRSWLGGLLAASGLLAGFTFKATAQAVIPQQPTFHTTDETAQQAAHLLPTAAEPAAQPAGTLVELRGVVLDAERCEPLPGVLVTLKNTAIGTYTNAEGEFTIRLKPTEQPAQLLFQSVGFISHEQPVALQGTAPRKLEIALDMQVMGELLVSHSPPWPWHPRAFYQWGKFWLTRPFR